MPKSIFKNHIFQLLALFLLTLPAFWFLLKPGIYWNMHDDMQLIRQLEMEKCLKDGQIPCRWTPDLGYGYGYPLFNFYPPLPYVIGLPLRALHFSFTTTVKLTAALQFISAAVAMYLLATSLFGPLGGILSSLFYTYAPYHAVNIYVRGAMNEAWASVFFPLILYFSKKYIDDRQRSSLIFLALSFSLLMLSHNPMVLIFSPIVLVWSLFWIYYQKSKAKVTTIVKLGLSTILAFCLSAFFTLPVIFETKLVQVESMFANYYHYSVHFVSLRQSFVSSFWGDGPSLWGPNDGLSFAVGYLHWIVPFLIIIYLFVKFIRRQKITTIDLVTIIIVSMGLFATFMTHERSTFIWQIITPIQKIQFPWRFLNLVAFLFSLSVGYLSLILVNLKPKFKLFVVLTTITGLLLINLPHYTPITSGPITDAQKFSGLAWTNQVTGGIYDYLPKTASTAPKSPAKDYIDTIIPATTKFSLSGQKKGTDWQFFNINLDTPATVYLPILAFPGFKINIDGKTVPYQIEPELGRISLSLSKGTHQIYIKLFNTPIRTLGNCLSLFALVFTLTYLLYPYGRNRN